MMVGVALIVAGAVLAFLSLTFFRLIECSDPGGCREYLVVFWPWLIPGIALVAVGFAVVGAGHRSPRWVFLLGGFALLVAGAMFVAVSFLLTCGLLYCPVVNLEWYATGIALIAMGVAAVGVSQVRGPIRQETHA